MILVLMLNSAEATLSLCLCKIVYFSWGSLTWMFVLLSPFSLFNLEIMPLTLTKDAETFNGLESDPASPQERQSPLGELQAAFKDSDLNSEEFKENILTRQSEAEDNSQSELKDTGSALHFPKKRSAPTVIVDRCCNYGCYRRELARFCWDEAKCVFHLIITCILTGIRVHWCLCHPHWVLEYEKSPFGLGFLILCVRRYSLHCCSFSQ